MELSEELAAAIWWSAILLLKLASFPLIIGLTRVSRKIFVAEEDVTFFSGQVKTSDVVIERRRRAHLNDMENIIPFIGLILLYAASGAGEAGCVTLVSQIFTAARFLHTVVYIGEVPQPARALTWVVGMVCNVYLGVKILLHLVNQY